MEANDAGRRESVFRNTPALKLTPVKHRQNGSILDWDVGQLRSIYDLQHQFGHLSRLGFHRPNIPTNDSETDISEGHSVNRNSDGGRNQRKDLLGLQEGTLAIPQHLPNVKNDGSLW